MEIKEGDRVALNPAKNAGDNAHGILEHVYPGIHERVGIVNFPTGRKKILLDDLVVISDTVTLTRERFQELIEQVLDRDSLNISDDSYEILKASGELIFKRFETLLFDEGGNG